MTIIIALIPALAWGSIGLVSGKLGGNAYQQTLGMTLGAFIFGIGTFLIVHPAIDTKTWLLGILSGLFWALGQSQQFQTMKYLGVSMTVPMSTGLQLVGNTLAGVLLFHEWTSFKDYSLGFLALIFLVLGAVLTSRKEKTGDSSSNAMFGKGMRTLAISTIGYVGYTIIINAGHLSASAVVLPQSVGMVLGALLFAYGHHAFNKKTGLNIITGLFWGTGNVFQLIAMASVGLAVSFSMAQMGIVISTFGSIFLLGEHKTHKEMIWVTIGSVLIIAGGILLGIMK